MEFKNIGFIGCGNMGGAIARACAGKGRLFLANRSKEKAEALAAELPTACSGSNQSVAGAADLLFLAVKPHMMKEMLADLAATLSTRSDRFVLVSMAACLTTGTIAEMAGGDYPVIRIMPNTPVSIGEGVVQYCTRNVTPEEELAFLEVMSGAGRLDRLDESLMDAASSLSGCGPAFIYPIIEALADGAVACGLPRAKAMEYAAQTIVGAGKLYLATKEHPGALKDAVCSPGGSTIRGVRVLEERAVRAAFMDAVLAAFDKHRDMGKQS